MKNPFQLSQNKTTVSNEIRAGLTTFVAMAYIIFLNPVFLSQTGMNAEGVLAATCLSAAVGTILSAVLSNRPFVMASGMGVNAYFTYTLCLGAGFSWQQALAVTFISGVVFLVVALLAGKKALIFIPENLRYAITAGIGLFLMLIGLLDAGLVKMTAGFPELGDLSSLPVMTSLLGLLIIYVLTVQKVRGSLMIGMVITVAFSIFTGQTALPSRLVALPTAITEVWFHMDFTGLVGAVPFAELLGIIVSLSVVDMFDTLGFLIGTVSRTDDLGKVDSAKNLDRVMIADAVATMIGAICGTSTVTTYAESAAGIEAGGRTGLTALTTAACFLLAVFFSPVASVFTSSVTAPALIIVGILLLSDIQKVHFDGMDEIIPTLVTVTLMPMTYSITTGIAAGFLAYVICKIAAGKARELKVPMLILCFVFVFYFCLQ